MISLGVITLLVVGISQTQATFSEGFLYPFPLDSFLTCLVPNPFGNVFGENKFIDETPPRLPIAVLDRQPNQNGTLRDVWLPPESP